MLILIKIMPPILITSTTTTTHTRFSLGPQVTEHNRGAANYGQLQKRHEQLLGEVRQLEGTLADYNLAMDKHRVSTDPAELNDYINEFEAKNKQFAAEVGGAEKRARARERRRDLRARARVTSRARARATNRATNLLETMPESARARDDAFDPPPLVPCSAVDDGSCSERRSTACS